MSPMARPDTPGASASSSVVSRRLCRNSRNSRPNGSESPLLCPPRDDASGRRAQEGQNLGRGACSSTIFAASASVSTDGGEPARGLLAVSFMHRTAMTPMTAAPVE